MSWGCDAGVCIVEIASWQAASTLCRNLLDTAAAAAEH